MSLLIQDHLRGGASLDSLLTDFAITSKRHPTHHSLVLLKYNQIASDFSNLMVRECRGIILDEARDWAVVSRAFDRFANYGEPSAATIDWSTARVQEKLDGSLCVLYHHADEWHVATSGTPDASGDTHGSGKTFREYFWETFTAHGGETPDKGVGEDLCFAFELMGPLNRVVVVHAEPTLRLLSVRHRVTGEQFPPEEFSPAIGIRPVRSFPLQSFDDIARSFADMNPLRQEGYVVVDGAFNRVKVKHPGYVALHHAKDGMTQRAFVDIARTGETSEVIAAFPEFKPLLDTAKAKYEALVATVEADYARIKDIRAQKDFAFEALKTSHSAALFQIRRGKTSREFFKEVHVDKLIGWMGMDANDSIPEVA